MGLRHPHNSKERATIAYHELFNYSLNNKELTKWSVGPKVKINNLPRKRKLKANSNKKFSSQKIKIAKKAVETLGKIKTIKMVAVTGSLAMMNASKDSDIDLMIITKAGTLWLTRLVSYFWLWINNYDLRKPGDKNERDKLCLNMWLDECDLIIEKQNIFTAHEIAQIIPLLNKNKTYERFLWENKWILEFWPKAVKINETSEVKPRDALLVLIIEKLAFWLQYAYMKRKITREVITPTRAFFHPVDWSGYVTKKFRYITLQTQQR